MSSTATSAQFIELLKTQRYADAIREWHRTPELKDMNGSGMEGLQAVLKWAPQFFPYYTQYMQNIFPGHYPMLAGYALGEGQPESLSYVLEVRPSALREHDEPLRLLHNVYSNAREHDQDPFKEPYTDYMRAFGETGALTSTNHAELTPLAIALLGGTSQAADAAIYLMQNGADMRALSGGENTLKDLAVIFASAGFEEPYEQFTERVDAELKRAKLLSTMKPEDVLQDYEKGSEVRYMVHMLLSANQGEVLTDPDYWKKHGGSGAAVEFTGRLSELIPDYLAYMRERLDCAALLREETLPREGSVTVGYARGNAAAFAKAEGKRE